MRLFLYVLLRFLGKVYDVVQPEEHGIEIKGKDSVTFELWCCGKCLLKYDWDFGEVFCEMEKVLWAFLKGFIAKKGC